MFTRKLVQDCNYVNEKAFGFTDNVKVIRDGASLTLSWAKIPLGVRINVETVSNAFLWGKYINFAMRKVDNVLKSSIDYFDL